MRGKMQKNRIGRTGRRLAGCLLALLMMVGIMPQYASVTKLSAETIDSDAADAGGQAKAPGYAEKKEAEAEQPYFFSKDESSPFYQDVILEYNLYDDVLQAVTGQRIPDEALSEGVETDGDMQTGTQADEHTQTDGNISADMSIGEIATDDGPIDQTVAGDGSIGEVAVGAMDQTAAGDTRSDGSTAGAAQTDAPKTASYAEEEILLLEEREDVTYMLTEDINQVLIQKEHLQTYEDGSYYFFLEFESGNVLAYKIEISAESGTESGDMTPEGGTPEEGMPEGGTPEDGTTEENPGGSDIDNPDGTEGNEEMTDPETDTDGNDETEDAGTDAGGEDETAGGEDETADSEDGTADSEDETTEQEGEDKEAEDGKAKEDTKDQPAKSETLKEASEAAPQTKADTIPTYYIPKSGLANVYYYYDIQGGGSTTDGINETRYRIYNTANGLLYPCDENGQNVINRPVDHSTEIPQPNDDTADTMVPVNFEKADVSWTFFGQYTLLTAAASYYKPADNISSGEYGASQNATIYNGSGRGSAATGKLTGTSYGANSSSALLTSSTGHPDGSDVYKAFLVEYRFPTYDDNATEEINMPMELVGPGGGTMRSNGYLPEDANLTAISGGGALSDGGSPSYLYHISGDAVQSQNSHVAAAASVTDVTDFVKQQGFGTYYGVDVRTQTARWDAAIGWQLIVLERDTSLDYNRYVKIALTPRGFESSRINNVTIDFDLPGITTPTNTDSDFTGQLILVAGDSNTNNGKGTAGSSQLSLAFYPDASDSSSRIDVGSNDPATTWVDRPAGSFANHMISRDGVRESNVDPANASNLHNFSMEVANITNNQKTNWATSGGHNLYLKHDVSDLRVQVSSTAGSTFYLTAASFDVEIPIFATEITHVNAAGDAGGEVIAGETIEIRASAGQVDGVLGSIIGSLNTKVVLTLDKSLTITDPEHISAVFTYTRNGVPGQMEVTGVYDAAHHSLTFDFGTDVTDAGGTPQELYNAIGDELSVSFSAVTGTDPAAGLTNTIAVWAEDIYTNSQAVLPYQASRYAENEDIFDTVRGEIYIEKEASTDGTVKNGSEALPVEVTKDTIITYKLTAHNGTSSIVSADIVDELPKGLTILTDPGTHTAGMTLDTTDDGRIVVSWEEADIPATGTAEFEFQAAVEAAADLYRNVARMLIDGDENQTRWSNETFHMLQTASLTIRKVTENYADYGSGLADDAFIIHVNRQEGDTKEPLASTVLKHGEASKPLTAVLDDIDHAGVTINVEEVIPMEYGDSYRIEIDCSDFKPAELDPETGLITIYPGNTVEITVIGSFEGTPYFKDRDTKEAVITHET